MYKFERDGITISNNKFIFDGENLSNMFLISDVTRSVLPTLSTNNKNIPGKYGLIFTDRVVNNRVITVEIVIIENDMTETVRQANIIASTLFTKEPKKLELLDTGRYNYAILTDSTEIDKIGRTGKATLKFECFDPFNYGDLKTVPINSTFNNVGFDTVGKITCKTNATEIIQVKQRDKVMMTIEHEITADKDLVIDLDKHLITLNGISIMKFLSLDSDFFLIDKGINKIEVTNVSSGSVEYHERWL